MLHKPIQILFSNNSKVWNISKNIKEETPVRLPMVTADELHAIKKMRGSGYTYREIAEEYNLKPSTVAYQIKKLKGKPEDSFIEMIHASQFTPKETLIEFDVHGFERHRIKNTLYTTGAEIFEMRGGVIHKTSMRRGFSGGDYPKLVTLIQKYGRGWYRKMDDDSDSHVQSVEAIFHYHFGQKGILEFLELDPADFNLYATKYVPNAYRKAVEGLPPIPYLLNPAMADEYMQWVKENKKPNLWMRKVPHAAWANSDSADNKIAVLTYLNKMDIDYDQLTNILRDRVDKEVKRLQKMLRFDPLFEGTGWPWKGPEHRGAPPSYFINLRNKARKTINERMDKKMPKILIEYYKEKGINKKDIPRLTMEPNPDPNYQ